VTADQSIAVVFPADAVREGAMAPVLRTEGLTVRFGGLTALDSVDFEIRRGEIRAIIGPNGAGKSTFFNCLTGVLRPTGGRILFNGENIAGLPSNLISQKGIARSYQITNILPNATTLENVRIAAQSRRHGWSMLRHHSAYLDIIDKAEAVLEAVGLRAKAHELAARISLAEKNYDTALTEFGQANQQNPDVLYLTGVAYKAKGDAANAKSFFTKAAKFNSLPQLNYAFVRAKAEKAIAS
jgi:ABC-type branched-subunit amino acid transport system ATPase component